MLVKPGMVRASAWFSSNFYRITPGLVGVDRDENRRGVLVCDTSTVPTAVFKEQILPFIAHRQTWNSLRLTSMNVRDVMQSAASLSWPWPERVRLFEIEQTTSSNSSALAYSFKGNTDGYYTQFYVDELPKKNDQWVYIPYRLDPLLITDRDYGLEIIVQ